MMPEDFRNLTPQQLQDAAASELQYIRELGTDDAMIMASTNLGAYEALLYILSNGMDGTPVYQAVTNVQSRYSTQSGILSRIKAMRQLGLLVERPGMKKSQVYLAPSARLLNDLGPILSRKHRILD
jgi:hypothetical protein